MLSPIIMPTYIYISIISTSFLSSLPLNSIMLIISIVAIFTGIVPLITIAWNKSNSIESNNVKEKLYPYFIIAVCYMFTAYMLFKIGLPIWIPSFLIGGVLCVIILALLRKSFHISAHLTGMGAYIGVMYTLAKLNFSIPLEWMIIVILITGVLGSCRAYLKNYSPGELLTGVILGFVWSFSAFYIGILF